MSFIVSNVYHSGLVEVLSLQISKRNQTPIFKLEWVLQFTPYAQLCPIPSPLFLLIFSQVYQVFFPVLYSQLDFFTVFLKNQYKGGRNWTKLRFGGGSYDSFQYKNQGLIHLRNVED